MKAIQMEQVGTPDVLQWQDVPDLSAPAPGQARVKLMAAGLNYIDVYLRSGTYLHDFPLPTIPGLERTGIVEAVGEGVTTVKPGVYPFGELLRTALLTTARWVPMPKQVMCLPIA